MLYRAAREILLKENPIPSFPYVKCFNDTTMKSRKHSYFRAEEKRSSKIGPCHISIPHCHCEPFLRPAITMVCTSQNIPNPCTVLPGTSLKKPSPADSPLLSFTRTGIFSHILQPSTKHTLNHVFLRDRAMSYLSCGD